ncbi:MAG TPA: hypothetical protein VMS17_04920 [Gemmataceae bacterium]|nr:hypothetical protein [Gemmataceae bacterium]
MKIKGARCSPRFMRCMMLSMVLCLFEPLAGGLSRAWAMGFYVLPTPLATEFAGADFVVVGMLYGGDAKANTTEAAILTIIKDHPVLKDKKHFTLNRYVPTDNDAPKHVVIFGAVVKGDLDAYRGILVSGKDEELIGYIKGIRDLKKDNTHDKLAFYFNYLESRQTEIALDACRPFQDATFTQLKLASDIYDAEKLKGWIADDKVPAYRKELYQVLLVFCQKAAKP